MVILPVLMVFIGFFVVFYSSIVDFLTTYLPENIVKYSLPAGLAGWGVYSITTGNPEFFLGSLRMTLVAFFIGGALYYSRHWASGDMWLMGVASALLAPAFSDFWPMFFIYAGFWAGVLGILYYFYFFFRYGVYRKHVPLLLVFFASLLFLALDPFGNIVVMGLAFVLLVLFTRKDVEELFIFEKNVKDLEEDDWILEDVKLKGVTLKSSMPIGKKEAELARKLGKGKVRVRGGVPMTPAFSFAVLTLLLL
jgi:hypothetical protein